MKIKKLKTQIQQITFESEHPTNGYTSFEPWHRLRNLIASHYKKQSSDIISFEITLSSLKIYWRQFYE